MTAVGTESSIGSVSQDVYCIQPLEDLRWDHFVKTHHAATIFHTTPWLDAIHRTYRYTPIVYTTSPPGVALQNGIVFCHVDSTLTGRRLVSLPFSDHCEPLCDDAVLSAIWSVLQADVVRRRVRYIELRSKCPLHISSTLFRSQLTYAWHSLDVRPDVDALLRKCHKDAVQRKIRRAEREGLCYDDGQSEVLLRSFCELHALTRRRQGIPPHPERWFRNLITCFGKALKIRAAFKGNRCVASIITVRHRDTVVYKYGCSDRSFSNLGGTQLLLWRTILEAKRDGLGLLDLGRSDLGIPGLITFKDRWGARRSSLTYSRFTASVGASGNYVSGGPDRLSLAARRVCGHLPLCILRFAGNVLYRHIG